MEDLGHDPGKIIFTNASAKDAQLGAGVVRLGPCPEQTSALQIGIGPATRWNVHLAELMAIWYATKMIQDLETRTRLQDNVEAAGPAMDAIKTYTVASDSQSALKATIKAAAKSGQAIVQRILDQVQTLEKWNVRVRLCWVPGHANNEGIEAADRLAKQAVGNTEDHDFRTPLAAYRRALHQMIEKEWRDEWITSEKGKHLKKIDCGLPSKRALRLYGPLTRHEAYLLTQLRSDHSWLSSYGKKRNFVDHDKCSCGAVETVVHVLVDCPLLRELRWKLRRKVGNAFGSIATLLGGRNGQGQVNNGSNDRDVVKAVLEFADASQRFKSRTSAVRSSGHSRP
jgi:ribonuclease HI